MLLGGRRVGGVEGGGREGAGGAGWGVEGGGRESMPNDTLPDFFFTPDIFYVTFITIIVIRIGYGTNTNRALGQPNAIRSSARLLIAAECLNH